MIEAEWNSNSVASNQEQQCDWPLIPLGQLCSISAGGTPKRSQPEYFGGGIPWVKIGDLTNDFVLQTEETLTEEGIANSSAKIFPKGTVLISIFATIGRTSILGIEAATNQAIAGITPKNESQLLPEYLKYALDSKHAWLNRQARGVAQPNINSTILKSLLVPLPPMEEQRRIVDILKRADSIRRLRKQAINTARQLIPALFIDMFGDPVTNPKGWPTITLGEISSEMRYGTSKKCHGNPAIDDLPVLRIPNILDGKVDWKDLKFATLRKKEIDNLLLQDGDLLFVRTNGNPDYIGRCAVFVGDRKTLFASYLIRVRLSRQSECDPLYVKTALSMDSYREVIVRQSKTTAGNFNISQRGLGPLVLPCPKKSMQQEFVTKLSDIQSIITQQENALDKAEMVFQSLLDANFANQNMEAMG